MEWFFVIYLLLSLFVMDVIEPHNDEDHPIMMTVVCFIFGGMIFIFSMIQSIINIIVKIKRGS